MELGDVIQLGRHRLCYGDAFNPEHRDALLEDRRPDMILTDPPYGMKLDADFSGMKLYGKYKETGARFCPERQGRGTKYDPVPGDEVPFDPEPIMTAYKRVKEQFWFGADYYAERIPDRNKGAFLVWDKRNGGQLDKMWGSGFELIWSKKRHKRDLIRVMWAGMWGTQWEPEHRRLGATQKPIKLMNWFLEKYSKEGALILDLFGGTGPVLLSAEQLGRTAYLIERDLAMVEITISRWRSLTGWTQTQIAEAAS